ncbi:MAG: DUF4142 domain-containing protein [Cytophagales bacterium]|nr:DUF4142 domain-containing protein [Cytophagales bacterium]
MKSTVLTLFIASALLVACDPSPNREDTKEVAEEQNEERIEATAAGNAQDADGKEKAEDKMEDDAEFMVEAASSGMLEVQLANMAMQKASSPQVKEFARMMIEDHGKANKELKALAASKNIVLPTALIDEHQSVANDLKDETGKDFDEEFMEKMNAAHKKDVEMFEKASKDGQDPDIRSFAAKTLPTLRNHLQHTDHLEQRVN